MSIVLGLLVRLTAVGLGLLAMMFFFGYATNQSSANLVIAIILVIGALLMGEFYKQKFHRR